MVNCMSQILINTNEVRFFKVNESLYNDVLAILAIPGLSFYEKEICEHIKYCYEHILPINNNYYFPFLHIEDKYLHKNRLFS